MAYLILVRHGKSEWNVLGKWTGWTDISLNTEGITEAYKAAEELKDIRIDEAFTSKLKRAQETLQIILKDLHDENIPVTQDAALNEKNYGELTGKNKRKIKEEYGDEKFMEWRRSWDVVVPGGESLQMVYERVVPYYTEHILPLLKKDRNVIVSSHGNTLRALVKYLDVIPDSGISNLEIATGEIYLYTIDENGNVVKKEIRAEHENTV